MRTHPHAEAVYTVVPLSTGGFGVVVTIPDSSPTTVTRFDSEADAETWIARNKERVVEQSLRGRSSFRHSHPRT
jgi:hypothetical protein